jgi:hypothetical protein
MMMQDSKQTGDLSLIIDLGPFARSLPFHSSDDEKSRCSEDCHEVMMVVECPKV